jgi:hypothetical protein
LSYILFQITLLAARSKAGNGRPGYPLYETDPAFLGSGKSPKIGFALAISQAPGPVAYSVVAKSTDIPPTDSSAHYRKQTFLIMTVAVFMISLLI